MPATTTHHVFAAALQKSDVWIHDLMRELGCDDPQQVYAALRATLHALRDMLTIEESAQLASQLPLIIRGVYFEGWKPRRRAARVHHLEEFEARIHWESHRPFDVSLDRIIKAVFALLVRHISAGEITDVVRSLPQELQELWPPSTTGRR